MAVPGFDFETPKSAVRHATDCAMERGQNNTSFLAVNSHYKRQENKRKFLNQDFGVNKMWKATSIDYIYREIFLE